MADLLGPSGQPLRPDQLFSQQQNLKAGLTIDTSSSQKAFEDLQNLFKKMIKSMGAEWDNASNESLRSQERLYRAIGDKQREHKAMVERLKNEAIAAIEEEKSKKLAALDAEMKAAEGNAAKMRQLEDQKTQASVKADSDRKNIEDRSRKNLSRETGLGGLIRGTASEMGAKIGGPIGGLVSGAGEMLANPYALGAMAIFEMFKTKAAFTKTGAELAGAGFGLGSGAGVGLNFATKLFNPTNFGPLGRLGQALSQGEQQAIIGQMAGSRTMIDQTKVAGGFDAVRGNLGLFANILPDAAKDMEIMTDATKSLGMSQKDITNTFVASRVNAEHLKITQLDAIKTQMDMAKALRNITNDGVVAASTLSNITDYLNAIGASEAEKQRIGVAVAQAGASLTLPQMAGMFAFTHKGQMPTEQDLFGKEGIGGIMGKNGTGPFQLMGSFLSQIGDQFKNNPTARMFAANQLQTQFLPGLRLQDTPEFFNLTRDMMKPGAKPEDFAKRFQSLEEKTPQVAMAEGIKTLSEIVDPIKRMENVFTNFWTFLDDRINKIMQALPWSKGFSMGHQVGQWVDKNILHRSSATGSPTSDGRWTDSQGRGHTPH